FIGPSSPPSALDPAKETRIPAPALESAAGVALLQSLGLELPPLLRNRVQRLTYTVVIQCALRQAFAGRDAEECAVSASAEAPDGRLLTWQGYNWLETKGKRRKHADRNLITFYDSTILNESQALLAALQLRQDPYDHGFALRVTRKFPELFSTWL